MTSESNPLQTLIVNNKSGACVLIQAAALAFLRNLWTLARQKFARPFSTATVFCRKKLQNMSPDNATSIVRNEDLRVRGIV